MKNHNSNEYIYKTTVTIGDTNIFQNMYFVNFFKIQGEVRELWVRDCVEGYRESLQGNLILVTYRASFQFLRDFFLFDNLVVKMQFTLIRRASTDILFHFYKDSCSNIYAEGRQTIVFLDRSQNFIKIPENFKKAIIKYSAENNDFASSHL